MSMPPPQAAGPVAIDSVREFWDKIAQPDYQEFRRNSGDLRAAFHAAVSLFHVSDWVWKDHKAGHLAMFGANNLRHLREHITEKKCPDFGLIGDVANASKHFRLDRPSAMMKSATGIISQATHIELGAIGEVALGEMPFGWMPQVVLELPGGVRDFSEIAKNVYEMWERLLREQGW